MTTKVSHDEHELAEGTRVQKIREAYKTLAFMPMILDDSDLNTKEMRVYLHLLRRAGANDTAWPSYQVMADHCFGHDSQSPRTRKDWAMAAIKGLASRNMITKTERMGDNGYKSNLYHITAPSEWVDPSRSPATTLVATERPSGSRSPATPLVAPQRPKGTKDEGTKDEGSKKKVGFSGKSDVPLDFRNGGTQYVGRNRQDQTRLGLLVNNVEQHIPIKEFRALVDAYADATHQREIVDADTDTASKALHDVQDCVLTLVQLGLRTAEEIVALVQDFHKQNDWFKGIPSANQMTKHFQVMKREDSTDGKASASNEWDVDWDAEVAKNKDRFSLDPIPARDDGA